MSKADAPVDLERARMEVVLVSGPPKKKGWRSAAPALLSNVSGRDQSL
jgi:hypothetical protein